MGLGEKRWLSLRESSAWSGLSVRTLFRLLAEGRLTGHRPETKRVLIDRYELDTFMEKSGRRKQPA